MRDLSQRLYSAIGIWHKARKQEAHPKFIKRLAENVDKLMEEKKKNETKDTIA